MKDLLAGKKIEDFEKALFRDGDAEDWEEGFYIASCGDYHLSFRAEPALERMRAKIDGPMGWGQMKPLPKQTPLSDLEIKEALVGIVVEAKSKSGIAYIGSLGFVGDESNTPWVVCGCFFDETQLNQFKNPTTRKMEPITRENLINAGLLND